jgi:tRNA G18 (ribose-2'-O)-methylase SpoU
MKENRKLSMAELNRLTIEEFKETKKIPLIIVLDNVRSLNNIGSIFRTSDALGVEAIYICGISATPPHPEIHKTALGAEDSVVWEYFDTAAKAVDSLHKNAYKVFALEQTTQCTDIRNFLPSIEGKYAFVFGNELKGVSQQTIDQCDGTIEIPQFGTKHSFNVAVTAGITIWDFFVKQTAKR